MRIPKIAVVALTLLCVISCGTDPTVDHRTIIFHTFYNIKPNVDTDLYPADIMEISNPFEGLSSNEKIKNSIFSIIQLNDQVNGGGAKIDIKSFANGTVDMDNCNGVRDQLDAIFSEQKIDKSLLNSRYKPTFDPKTYLNNYTAKENFFILHSSDINFNCRNHKCYSNVEDIRAAISAFLETNDSTKTVIVAYNPPLEIFNLPPVIEPRSSKGPKPTTFPKTRAVELDDIKISCKQIDERTTFTWTATPSVFEVLILDEENEEIKFKSKRVKSTEINVSEIENLELQHNYRLTVKYKNTTLHSDSRNFSLGIYNHKTIIEPSCCK